MIIVNQDRDWIFNFNNTTSIGIDEGNTLKAVSVVGTWSVLGNYKTEERAKQVLQEIIENLYPKSNINMDIDGINFGVQSPIYKMPLE